MTTDRSAIRASPRESARKTSRVNESLAGQTLAAARRTLAAQLRAQNIETPDLDARLLVGEVAGLDLTQLVLAAERVLTPEQAIRLEDFARRRIAGEPVARILGHQEFWGLTLQLSPDTLVPRPDTETMVEAALDLARDWTDRAALRIADLGTGTGAILLALLSEWPNARGVATDLSCEALRTARGNADRLGLGARTRFVACDYAAALKGPFDLIVSNPPYIPAAEIATLAVEVSDHDPRRALDGGDDGLDAYRAIAPQAAALLSPGGALIVEVGQGQSEPVAGLMAASGLTLDAPRPDLGGIFRAVIGRKPPL
uniref:Release factor glutamine methyltransferase n=1 Tax=Rhodopseudomonas palustris (strain BisA53) TaxID=316055 RepID=Q07VB2_RHOP5